MSPGDVKEEVETASNNTKAMIWSQLSMGTNVTWTYCPDNSSKGDQAVPMT